MNIQTTRIRSYATVSSLAGNIFAGQGKEDSTVRPDSIFAGQGTSSLAFEL